VHPARPRWSRECDGASETTRCARRVCRAPSRGRLGRLALYIMIVLNLLGASCPQKQQQVGFLWQAATSDSAKGVDAWRSTVPSSRSLTQRLLAERRHLAVGLVTAAITPVAVGQPMAHAEEDMPFEKMDAVPEGKRRTRMPGFTVLPSGLQIKDVVEGKPDASQPLPGSTCVLTWEGFTINYFGRPFETRTLNSISKVDQDPIRFKVGDGTVIPAIDEAVRGMREGGVRQLIVPVELGYDEAKKLLPRPSTFSGQRALDFVLDNKGGMMDKTLLININLKRVYKET